jgi:hypothetical protein
MPEPITPAEYLGFQKAYDFFNAELFGGTLPHVLCRMWNGLSHRMSSAMSKRSIPATPLASPGCTFRSRPGGPDL